MVRRPSTPNYRAARRAQSCRLRVRAFTYSAPSRSSNRPEIWRHLSEGGRSLSRRYLEDEPADVRTLRAAVNMPLVSVFAVGTVRLDARQAHGAAGAVRAFPMIEIRRHSDAFLPPSGVAGHLSKRASSGLAGSDEFVAMPSVATTVKARRSLPPLEEWKDIREPWHICRVSG